MSKDTQVYPRLNSLKCYEFSDLIPENQREIFLNKNGKDISYLRAGISQDGKPAGVALVRLTDEKDSAFLDHFYVRPEFRRRRLGSRLFSALVEELREENREKLRVEYRDRTESGARFGKFLGEMGFSRPELSRIKLEMSSAALQEIRWFKEFVPPAEFEVFPWRKATKTDRPKLKNSAWLPESLNPFEIKEFDKGISRGLRRDGEIIGWLLIHEKEPGQFEIPTGYVSKEKRDRFLLGLLIWPVLSDALAKGMEKLSFTIPTDFPDHIDFHESHTKPHAEKFYYMYSRKKEL